MDLISSAVQEVSAIMLSKNLNVWRPFIMSAPVQDGAFGVATDVFDPAAKKLNLSLTVWTLLRRPASRLGFQTLVQTS